MRILDTKNNQALTSIGLYLTPEEAKQMVGYLEDLLSAPDENHSHLNDLDYKHEITISIYTESNIKTYDERSRRLIAQDK